MPRKRTIKRRSGNAVTEYCTLQQFVPNTIVMGGVGINHEEVDCFRETWGETFSLFGFEPNPKTYKAIRHSFPGTLRPFALAAHDGERELFVKGRHTDAASLFDRDDAETAKHNIQARTLDRYLGEMDTGNILLWLDCEGAEKEVIEGGHQFMQQVDVLNIELTGAPRMEGWPSPQYLYSVLKDYGLLPVWVHTTRSCIGQFDCIFMRKEAIDPRYCAFPSTLEEL